MGFFYRHRIALFIAALSIVVIVTFGVCFFALSKTAGTGTRLTVVIDAGHGGVDGGVVGKTTGTKESDVNLAISRYLQTEFENAGFRVVQTRLDESGLYGAATSGFKKRDMNKRAQIIKETAPSLVVSVHQNFFSLSSRRGAQVFYKESDARSKELAENIQAQLNGMEECVKKTSPLAGDYFMLNCHEFPAVIVECGFLSNPDDEALLINPNYQKRIASVIAQGAIAFLVSSVNG